MPKKFLPVFFFMFMSLASALPSGASQAALAYPVTLQHTVAIPKRERAPENYKGAKAYLVEKRPHREKELDVLIQKHLIPMGSKVQFVMDKELDYRSFLTDWNVIVSHSKPFFRTRVLEIPADATIPELERKALLSGEFLVNSFDLGPDRIVALREHKPLPGGVKKSEHILPWEDWNPVGNWAYAIERALKNKKNQFLLLSPPKDMEYLCPKLPSLDQDQRLAFLQTLISEMSWRESSFVPFTFSDEGKYTAGSEGILSTGLMQLSINSTKAACYQDRGCDQIRVQKDLFDPEKNLTCAVAVISCLTEKGNCFTCRTGEASWVGAARYWSVLREKHTRDCPTCFNGKVSLGKKEELQEVLKQSAPFCH